MTPGTALLALPGCVGALLFIAFFHCPASPTFRRRRDALAAALTVTLLLLVGLTEGLSATRMLTFPFVAGAWLVLAILAAATVWQVRKRAGAPPDPGGAPGTAPAAPAWLTRGLVAATTVIGLFLAVVAIASTPNSWDAMSYHLPRVMHWIQNRSVAHYPTHAIRQLYLNPLAEFALAHVMLLSGSDRWLPLLQWFCMAGSCVGVSLIARELGAHARGQALAALACATIPMGILQATGTQNDYVAAFLLVQTVYALLMLRRSDHVLWVVLFGVNLGLAVLAKATTYLFAAPFGVWACVVILRRGPLARRAVLRLACVGLAALAVNAGHYARNTRLFHSPTGVREGTNPDIVRNRIMTPRAIASNLMRNAAIHLQTPYPAFNRGHARWIARLHEGMGIDPSDPRTTFTGCPFTWGILRFNTSRDYTGNTVHAVLLVLAAASLAGAGHRGRRLTPAVYLACLAAAFFLFCVLLKWQLWHGRLHLPLFVLAAPLLGALFEPVARPRVLALVGVLLAVQAAAFLFYNDRRPLAGPESVFTTRRVDEYFIERPRAKHRYANAVLRLVDTDAHRVGLVMGGDDWEYPLWALLRLCGRECRIEHIDVANISARLRHTTPPLDAVVHIEQYGKRIRVVPRDD